jgi:catechol 2,3-dioxygenase-like lactoylglutathione lyase family enzyme
MKIERIDHLNLTVADIDRSVEFYQRVLGMKAESMGEGRAALYFGQQKIHLDAAGGGDERRKTHAGAYLLYHRGAYGRGHNPSRNLRRSDPDARPARRRNRHDPIGLH